MHMWRQESIHFLSFTSFVQRL